jgi:hypothetical protein
METIRVIFTKRKWNPISFAIRVAIPRSLFCVAESSHCLIVDGEYLIEASMTHGTRRVKYSEAMKGLTVTALAEYEVPDAEAGLAWARTQVGSDYDFKGAFGLGLKPDREWAEDDKWFCYELAAATLQAAGRTSFRSVGHITGSMLLAICHN